jgi:hypothetical protein
MTKNRGLAQYRPWEMVAQAAITIRFAASGGRFGDFRGLRQYTGKSGI